MLKRIDNLFFSTANVERLSTYYSGLVNVPARRAQVEAPGLMWAEIPLGGMEMSFRKAGATTKIHPRGEDEFLEARPGQGVTISFEVHNTEEAIARLTKQGCKFYGKPLVCTGGMEIISIFQDPSGRAVQLYEPRFLVHKTGPARVAASAPSMLQGSPKFNASVSVQRQREIALALGVQADDSTHRWGYITASRVIAGSNLRDGRNLAYSAAFYDRDLAKTATFYSEILGQAPVLSSQRRVQFDVDGTILEFRSAHDEDGYANSAGLTASGRGGIPMIEVRNIGKARARMAELGVREIPFSDSQIDDARIRAAYLDVDGNAFEFWERPDSHPIVSAMIGSKISSAMEQWEFHSADTLATA